MHLPWDLVARYETDYNTIVGWKRVPVGSASLTFKIDPYAGEIWHP